MEIILGVLNAVAAVATIAGFAFDLARECKRYQTTREEKEKAGGNRP